MKDYNIESYVEKATSIFEKYTLYRDSTETKLKLSLYDIHT